MQRLELAAWLRLTLTPGVGNAAGRKLLAAFGLPQAIFGQSEAALTQVLNANLALALLREPPTLPKLVEDTWRWLQASDTGKPTTDGTPPQRTVLALGDSDYPQGLLQMADPPLLLYLLGQGNLGRNGGFDMARSIAMVGSRNPTPQGADNAYAFGYAMAQAGLTVVSGLALGVDGKAHEGALDGALAGTGVATIAVVGTGLDRVYPRRHLALAHRIAQQGLILSEYPIGTPPLAANFPKRNRLIASLGQGTLVVEAALQSGSLITARLAADMGREVFAIPGSIHSGMSRGCHALIRQGAKLVETAQDILEELHLPVPSAKSGGKLLAAVEEPLEGEGEAENEDATSAVAADANSLRSALGFDPVSLDALQARCGLPTPQLLAQLMELELSGQVARLPGGLFQQVGQA